MRLAVTYPDGLPLANVDAALIERALSNLLDNAIRVTPSGGAIDVDVSASELRGQPAIKVAVSDSGPGVSPEDQARVPKDLGAPYPGEVLVEAPAGAAVICNSSMWHAGTLKKTDAPRRMLHLSYTRRDLPQQLLQLDHLTPELYSRMTPVLRYLLEIEPPKPGDGVLRQPQKQHKGWWN